MDPHLLSPRSLSSRSTSTNSNFNPDSINMSAASTRTTTTTTTTPNQQQQPSINPAINLKPYNETLIKYLSSQGLNINPLRLRQSKLSNNLNSLNNSNSLQFANNNNNNTTRNRSSSNASINIANTVVGSVSALTNLIKTSTSPSYNSFSSSSYNNNNTAGNSFSNNTASNSNNSFMNSNTLSSSPSHIFGSLIHGSLSNSNNNNNNANNSNNLNSNQHVSQDQNLQIFLTGNGQFVFLPYNPIKKRDTSTNQDENDDDEGDDDDSEDENNNNNNNPNPNSNNTSSSNNGNPNSKKRRHHHNVTNHNFAVIVRLAKSHSLTSVVKAKYRVNIKTKWPSGILGTDESGKVKTVFKENYSVTPLFEWSLNMKNPDCFIPFKPQHHQSTNSSSSLPQQQHQQQQQQQQKSNSKKSKLPNRSNTNRNLNFSGSEISSTSDFDQTSMGLESKFTNDSYDDSVIDDETNYDDDFNFEFQENESISTNTNNSISSNQMITSKEPTQEIKYFELLNQHEYKTETADLATENFFLKDTPSYSDSSKDNHIDNASGVPKFFPAGYYIFILPIVYPLDTPETVSTPLTSISHNFDIQIEKLTLPALPPPQSALLSSTNYHNHHTNSSTSSNNPNSNHSANNTNTNNANNHNSSHNQSHNHDTNQDSYLDPYYNSHNSNNHTSNPLSHITSNSSVLSANSTTSGSGAGGFFKSLTHYGRRHSVSNNNNHNNNNENSIPAQLSTMNSNNSANNGLNTDYSGNPIISSNNNSNNNNNPAGKKKNGSMQGSNTDIVYGFDYELPVVRLPPSDATSTLNKSIYVNKIWNNALNYEILLPKKYVQLSPMSGTSDNFMKNHTFILQLKAIPLIKNLTLKRIKINVVEKITYISKDKKYEEDVGKVDQSGVKERTVTLYEIKTKEKSNSNALKSKIIPGCTNDNLLTFCYNGGKSPQQQQSNGGNFSLLAPNHDRKDTFLSSNSRSRSGSGSIFSSSRLNRSRSLSSFMDSNNNNNNSVNTTNSNDEDDVIITNPVKVKCPLTFQAADETGLLNEIHENLCKGQADLNEPLVEENLNKNVSNDDVISIFSNNSTNTLLDTGIVPTENIIYTNDGIKTEEVLAPSTSLNRNLSMKSTKSHRKSSFGAHANNSNSGNNNSNDPGAISTKLSGFHPDATFGNVKIRHRLQVCFRISKPDEKDIREGVPKIHHYEVIVDTPIVFVSPFCVRDNLDLPSYEYAVRSNTAFDFDNSSNNNRDSSDAFSFDRLQESNDEIEDQLPTFDEAVLLPSSPMQSSMMPNMSNMYSGGFNSTTVLSASPFSINSSIAFGSPSSFSMSVRDDTLGTFNNIDSLVAGDMSQLSLNNPNTGGGAVTSGRSGSNNNYRATNEIPSNKHNNSIDATLSLNVPTRNSVTGEEFGVPSNPSTPIESQQSHSLKPIDFAKRNSEYYQDKLLSNSLTTSGGDDTFIKNDGNVDTYDNNGHASIGKLSNMFKQQEILDNNNSNTNTNNSSKDGEINYPQSYFPDSNEDGLNPIGPAITHIPTQSSIKFNALHPTESNGYTHEPPTYDMVIKEDQLKKNGDDDDDDDDVHNRHGNSNDVGSDLSSVESVNRVSDESDGDASVEQNKYYRQDVHGAGGYEERLALLSDDDDEDADNSIIANKIGNASFMNENEVNKHYTNLDEKLTSTNGLIYETPNGSTNQLNDGVNLSVRRGSNNFIGTINAANRIKDNLMNSNFTNINTKDTVNTPTTDNNSEISFNSFNNHNTSHDINNENENDDLNTLSGVSISNLDAVELTEANRFI